MSEREYEQPQQCDPTVAQCATTDFGKGPKNQIAELSESEVTKKAEEIAGKLKKSSPAWFEAAEAFESIQGKKNQTRVAVKLGFTYSTARKLIKVAGSPQAKEVSEKCAIDQWGTLYDVALMTPAEFEKLKSAGFLAGGQLVTRRAVSKYRSLKSRKPRAPASHTRLLVYVDLLDSEITEQSLKDAILSVYPKAKVTTSLVKGDTDVGGEVTDDQ